MTTVQGVHVATAQDSSREADRLFYERLHMAQWVLSDQGFAARMSDSIRVSAESIINKFLMDGIKQ